MPTHNDLPLQEIAHLYVDKKMSSVQLGERYGVRKNIILRKLQEAGIQRRQNQNPPRMSLPIDEIKRLYLQEGISTPQIAKRFGVSDKLIRTRLDEVGVDRKKYRTDIPIDKLVILYEAGASMRELARRYKTARGTITRRLLEAGVAIRSLKWQPPLNLPSEDIARLYTQEKISAPDIAKRYQISRSAIERNLLENGVSIRPDNIKVTLPDASVLVRLYVTEKKSTLQIARKYGTSETTIRNHLNNAGVKLRPNYIRKKLPIDELLRLYCGDS